MNNDKSNGKQTASLNSQSLLNNRERVGSDLKYEELVFNHATDESKEEDCHTYSDNIKVNHTVAAMTNSSEENFNRTSMKSKKA